MGVGFPGGMHAGSGDSNTERAVQLQCTSGFSIDLQEGCTGSWAYVEGPIGVYARRHCGSSEASSYHGDDSGDSNNEQCNYNVGI